MKSIFLSFTFFLLANCAQATIRRCNNNPSVTGCYTTAQAAHNAANAGDTIHLEPTVNGSYGDLTITKKITLISTGDFLAQNPGYQTNFLQTGYCNNVTINTGADSSKISARVGNNINVNTNNIVITNSHCYSIVFPNNITISNISITKCYIDGNISSNYYAIFFTVANLMILNNYLQSIYNMAGNSSALIAYNVFSNQMTISNSIVANNIFYCNCNQSFNNCNVSNNISRGATGLPASNGNINNVDMSIVFVNWGTFNGDNYQLKPTYSNQDLGMYAGPNPYKPACTPAVPSIYNLVAPATTSGGNLNVTVSTRSNN